ncbi:peptidoglycan recognition protein family protein [Nigerium massiliense]|uniref:peptidoglycan recognition protein family protein n=1 Tax=Nigerium massiliense TaxID=1522317 RepID=UPI0006936A46|nr:peptidoglycan recognition protein [Nigerium massiliense]
MPAPAGVAVAGVTWRTVAGAKPVVYLRIVDAAGKATAWELQDQTNANPEDQTQGTDPTVVTGVAKVEVATVSAKPIKPELQVMSSRQTASDAVAASEKVSGTAIDGAPASLGIRTRAEWGANESITRTPYTYASVTGVMLHHTAGSNSYTQAEVPAILRSIQAYHINGRGWSDIAYNVLVDKYGTAWEGRGGGLNRAVQGGHGWGVTNARTFGLSFMGNYETAAPSAAMLDKAERIIAWKFQLHGVDPYGTTFGSGGQDGGSTFLNAISGHRDENATTCPGRNVYAKFGEIRSKVKGYLATDYDGNRSFNQDATGDGKPDVAIVDGKFVSIAQLMKQPSTPTRVLTLAEPARDAVLAGDLSGDGIRDIVVRTQDGTLQLYRGLTGGLTYSQTPTTLATGWGGYASFIAAPNFGGDIRSSLIALDRANRRILVFPSNGRGGLLKEQSITTAGVDYDLIGLAGTFNGDTTPDLVARRPGGSLDLLAGNGFGRVLSTTAGIGSGWDDAAAIVGGANFDGVGGPDILRVTTSGSIRLSPSTSQRFGTTSTLPGTVTMTTEFAGAYRPLTPARIYDSRTSGQAIPGYGVVTLQVTGAGGVPARNVGAVVLNLTATRAETAGHVKVWPSDGTEPSTSSLNFLPRTDTPNAVVVRVGADGKIKLRNGSSGSVHLIADVSGYHLGGTATVPGAFRAVDPARMLDTRSGTGVGTAVSGRGTASLKVTGVGGVPATGVSAVVLNVTATGQTSAGTISVYPSGTSAPRSSSLNMTPGTDTSNLVVVKVGSDGRINFANSASSATNLIADVAGYYLDGPVSAKGAFVPLNPARVLDTRSSIGAKGPVAARSAVVLKAAGGGGLPATGVAAVVINVTVTQPKAPGNIQVYPAGPAVPASSSLNFVAGQDVPNLVVATTGTGGGIALRNAAPDTTHLIGDVAGYYR